MSKKFDIHEWQASVRRLKEIKAQDVPGTAAFMGKNMRSGGMSNSEKNKASVDAFFKDLRDKEENPVVAKGDGIEITQDEMDKLHRDGRVRLKNGSLLVFPSKPLKIKEEDLNESLNPEVSKMVNRFIMGIAKKYSYSEQDAVFAVMAALRQRDFDGVNEHHGDDFPKDLLKKSVDKFLDDLKNKNEKDYDAVEDIIKKHFSIDEMNSLGSAGAGASFQAGNSDAYATPNAFGDDKKKKMKAYKSIGYKKV